MYENFVLTDNFDCYLKTYSISMYHIRLSEPVLTERVLKIWWFIMVVLCVVL